MGLSTITILQPATCCGTQCEHILRALPEWFGIEKSLLDYVTAANTKPTILAMDQNQAVGFLTISNHFSESAEIHCMGILPRYHRKGIGHLLLSHLETYLIDQGILLLQVKTLSENRICEPYDRTRKFYLSEGFIPLEVLPTLWGPRNPCLIMVKSLK